MPKIHHIPSYKQGFARYAAESQAPGLWKNLVGLWVPALGPTGVTLFDWSGYGNNGTLTLMDPATDWVVTEKGWAIDIIQEQKIQTGQLGISGKPMTVSGLFYCRSHSSQAYFLSVVDWFGGGAGTDWRLRWYGVDTRFEFTKWCSGTDITVIWGAGTYSFDTWHHFALTYDGGILAAGVDLWIDGELKSKASSTDGTGTVDTSTADFVIGAHTVNFDVSIGPIAVYDCVLLPTKLYSLYTDPYAMLRPRRVTLGKAAAAAANAPTGHLYGPLVGPFGGAI
jgi:hypothetical protein